MFVPLWNPMYRKEIRALENAQKRFIKMVCGDISYEVGLHLVGLMPLEKRRKLEDVVMMFEVINGLTHCNIKPKVCSKVSSTRLSSDFYFMFYYILS
uniref:Putative LOC101234605 [Hydra vulgaris] n=1 Tax=Lepeophtheirus salmonis TaxID=72036 RepID=A0A0K2TY51_LEPSM